MVTRLSTNPEAIDVVEFVIDAIPVAIGVFIISLFASGKVRFCRPRPYQRVNPDGTTEQGVSIPIVTGTDRCPEDPVPVVQPGP